MTTPNLDALAKLGPFTFDEAQNCGWFSGSDRTIIDENLIAAALNEWADLRAYKQRTEAALAKLTAMLEAVFDANPNSPVDDVLHKMDVDLGLYRDPANKEAK